MEHHTHRGSPVGRRERLLARLPSLHRRAAAERKPDPRTGSGKPRQDDNQAMAQVQEHR